MKKNDFNFDEKLYFKAIGLDSSINEKTNLETNKELLFKLVTCHVQNIPYHNCRIFKATNTVDLSLESLQERLLRKKLGGMCYETSELLWYALNHFGFIVNRVATFVLNNNDSNVPSTHNILIVDLQGAKFLIDVGFGYNSIREPLKFSFTETEIVETTLKEQYLLSCDNKYYELSMITKDKTLKFYRFKKDINLHGPEVIGYEQTLNNYQIFLKYKDSIPIRDCTIKFGAVTELGRIGYIYDTKENSFKKLLITQSTCIQTIFSTFLSFIQNICEDFEYSENYFKQDSSLLSNNFEDNKNIIGEIPTFSGLLQE